MDDAAGFAQRLHDAVQPAYANYEIVLVDNGSPAEGIPALRERLTTLPCIRVLRLSQEHDANTALFAGLEAAIGDIVVILDPITDPIESIAEIVELNLAGNDIVQGMSTVPLGGNWISRRGRDVFYWYNRRFVGVDIPNRATNLTGISRPSP